MVCWVTGASPASPWLSQVQPRGRRDAGKNKVYHVLVQEAGGLAAMQGHVGKPGVVGRQEVGVGFPGGEGESGQGKHVRTG